MNELPWKLSLYHVNWKECEEKRWDILLIITTVMDKIRGAPPKKTTF